MASEQSIGSEATPAASTDFAVLRKPAVREVKRGSDWVVVALQGELDLNNAWELREVLERECARRPTRLVLDLTEVSFLDSTTLHVLLEARKLLRDWGGVILAAPNPAVRRTLAVSCLDTVLAVEPESHDGRMAVIPGADVA